jgi:diguanylate cyclase (GGDEF)-like protein
MKGRIAVISNDNMLTSEMIPFYRKNYFDIQIFSNQKEGIENILNAEFDLILIDNSSLEEDPIQVIKLIRKNKPNLPIIILIPKGLEIQKILEMLKIGVFHYLSKENLIMEELIIYSNSALEFHNLKREYAALVQEIIQKQEGEKRKDEKTGLLNYTSFIQSMKNIERKAIKTGLPISILFLGIYNYDEILAQEGEIFASELITQVGMRIAKNLRASDIKGYYEDGIFSIGIEGGDIACALHVAEKISKLIKEQNFIINNKESKICLNIGAASLILGDQYNLDYLINAAYKAYLKAIKNIPGWIELHIESPETT